MAINAAKLMAKQQQRQVLQFPRTRECVRPEQMVAAEVATAVEMHAARGCLRGIGA
jgi:hypothetical protein